MGGGIGPGYFSLSQGQCGSVGRLLLQEWTLHLQLLPLTWLLSCQEGGMSMGTTAFLRA